MKSVKSFFPIMLVIIALAGCAGQDEQPGIIIELKPNKFSLSETGNEFDLIFENTTDEVIQIPSAPPALEYFDGKEWIELQRKDKAEFLTEYGTPWTIQPGDKQIYESISLDTLLRAYDFNFVPGKYRLKYGEWYGEFKLTK